MNDKCSRNVFILLSSNSLPYSRICIGTMLANSVEPLRLRLIADNKEEEQTLENGLRDVPVPDGSSLEIVGKDTVQERLYDLYPHMTGLHQLHEGHPCWRKIIDPIVLSSEQEDIIVADPDLVFPNYFAFEPMAQSGVRMMWQKANCLLPPAAVRQAFELGVPLANHVDIGVAQVHRGAIDLQWLDWFVKNMQVERFQNFMHIEAIVWSALAMKMGGEYFNPRAWKCWQRGHVKRIAIACGVPGRWTLKLENLAEMKCIHVSGMSKWWIAEAMKTGFIKETHKRLDAPTSGIDYCELRRADYEREQKIKSLARSLGYQKLVNRKKA